MAIDLTGLFVDDVEILLQGKGIKITSARQDCIDDALSLPQPIWVYEVQKGVVLITAHGVEPVALAERLATTWEERGYRVKRSFAPVFSNDWKEVQSFILV